MTYSGFMAVILNLGGEVQGAYIGIYYLIPVLPHGLKTEIVTMKKTRMA